MEIRKILLYIALAFVGMALWTNWTHFQIHQQSIAAQSAQIATQPQQGVKAPQVGVSEMKSSLPQVQAASAPVGHSVAISDPAQWIHVNTDRLQVSIDPVGGAIVSVHLRDYKANLSDQASGMALLSAQDKQLSIIKMGLAGKSGQVLPPISFTSDAQQFDLGKTKSALLVQLKGTTKDGLQVIRQYQFTRGSYQFTVKDILNNTGSKTWVGNQFSQLVHRVKKASKHAMGAHNFVGPAISSEQKPYKKLSFKMLSQNNLSRSIQGGWLALQQKYFITALVPNHVAINHYFSQMNPPGQASGGVLTFGVASPLMTLKPGQGQQHTLKIYTGPELVDQLALVAPHLPLTIDYGWLWWLSKPIFMVLEQIHHVVGNWGWSIIIITVLIKLMLHPFTAMSFKSMARMRDLAPRMQALKEKYGDDKQKLSQATMDIYRKEKINPLGGCLPMLLQIPFFIALYYVLIESVQLRQAPFILWIHDLSVRDPFFVLPVLMGLSMFAQQKLSPAPADPTQAKMMMLLPVFLTVMFFNFPAGLVLYWFTNNIITIIQQWWVNRQVASKKNNSRSL